MDNIEPGGWLATQTAPMTPQNAALGQACAAAAENLKDQATRLAQVVPMFRISA